MLDFNDRAPYRKILLVGNPNCGKTTLFNALTGSSQRVGNWSGVTVEQQKGVIKGCQGSMLIIDLPGTYALYPWQEPLALDEKITAQCIQEGAFDCILNVVDAANLERNLYLTSQLLERGLPVIVAINRMDILRKRGGRIDEAKLSRLLGCPVVALSAMARQGLDKLIGVLEGPLVPASLSIPYPKSIHKSFQNHGLSFNVAWHQWVRAIEGDESFYTTTALKSTAVNRAIADITEQELHDPDILIATARYHWIRATLKQVESQSENKGCMGVSHSHAATEVSSSLDRWVLDRTFGIPIFMAVMYLLFFFAINVGGAFQDFFDQGSEVLFVNAVWHLCQKLQCNGVLTTILTSGVGKGLNTVITFIPVIGSMFLALSFLEDSGYMSRAAFVMDRLMRLLGLPGKSFVPLIVGFGCNVPSIMGARTLEQRKDRILTVMISPFMSCGARLAIFTLFVAAFFEHNGQNIVFLLYLIGILMAILTGLMLKKTLLKGESEAMVLELPPYQWPRPANLLLHTWHRLKQFILNAGRLIIPVCVLIGALNSVTVDFKTRESSSKPTLLSAMAQEVTPLFAPMGIEQNNWPATVGLFTGMMAKEVVIGTLNSLYAQEAGFEISMAQNVDMKVAMKDAFSSVPIELNKLKSAILSPVASSADVVQMDSHIYGEMQKRFDGSQGAFAYLLFVLLYVPCVSTMAAMLKEVNMRWTLFSVAWTTLVAYSVATCFYQLATFKLHPLQSLSWILGFMTIFLGVIYQLYRYKAPKALPTPIVTAHKI